MRRRFKVPVSFIFEFPNVLLEGVRLKRLRLQFRMHYCTNRESIERKTTMCLRARRPRANWLHPIVRGQRGPVRTTSVGAPVSGAARGGGGTYIVGDFL